MISRSVPVDNESMQSDEFFRKIPLNEFLQKLTQVQTAGPVEMTLKSSQSDCFKAKLKEMKNSEWILGGSDVQLNKNDELMISLVLDDEKYLAQSKVNHNSWPILIDVPKDIYRVQRRRNFRIRIPQTMKSNLQLPMPNGQFKTTPLASETIPVNDLSLGGARLLLSSGSPMATIDYEFRAKLNLPKKVELIVTAVVKHIEPVITSPNEVYVGVEFRGLDSTTENKLYSFTMEIYRDYLQKVTSGI